MPKLVNIPCLVFWLRSICVSKYMIPQISSALPGQLVSTLESKHYFSDIKSLPISRVKLVTSFVILYDHIIHMPTCSVSVLFMVSEMQGRRSLWSRNSLTKCGINPYVLPMTQFVATSARMALFNTRSKCCFVFRATSRHLPSLESSNY